MMDWSPERAHDPVDPALQQANLAPAKPPPYSYAKFVFSVQNPAMIRMQLSHLLRPVGFVLSQRRERLFLGGDTFGQFVSLLDSL
jgi:hypothetical protein